MAVKHRCSECEKELTGKLDTFGDANYELCWDCWSGEEDWLEDGLYGLGPHEHLVVDGKLVFGGTTFKPLPEQIDTDLYNIDGRWFVPDPEAPGCGTWFNAEKKAREWLKIREVLHQRDDGGELSKK